MRTSPFAKLACSFLVLMCISSCGTAASTQQPEPLVWKLESASRIGDHATTVLGSPRLEREGGESALCFDGA